MFKIFSHLGNANQNYTDCKLLSIRYMEELLHCCASTLVLQWCLLLLLGLLVAMCLPASSLSVKEIEAIPVFVLGTILNCRVGTWLFMAPASTSASLKSITFLAK
jgi:hypothetical protein